ncbi:DinB family protein [Roseococcus pinisoli]|uniref:Damage-inducible protein DinB n=1 Tax=Roseococcus pinisoli TaxID=2835040 RepID=A0ABS5QB43_9PROT|nr:DinB family protein [Roseococcus pinisoli]MBS7810170.1 damage-inducible protein DinB [Roseococcus pinisoli]
MSAYPATVYFAAQARNNAWANHRLLKACARLSQEEFEATRTSFFPSIKATLNHILVVGRFYVDAMEGGTLGPAAFADPLPCATAAELHRAQGELDRRLLAWCEALDDPGRIVEVHRGTRIQRERADRLLLHCFEHDIHHRGQVHAMLSGTSVKPPQLDEFFSVGEAPLRAGDFAELGWTEADIWPETR